MIFTPLKLKEAYSIDLQSFTDVRGWFSRTYCKNEFAAIGHTAEWVQMNHSFTISKASIRGLHYQLPPHEEIKLIRCIAGSVLDVIVDLRKDSPTFLQWEMIELSAVNRKMIYIPAGFAHGFQTLTDNCELLYHHSAFYTPEAERAIRFDDPRLGIPWPLPAAAVSERDLSHPLLTDNFKGI